MLIRPPGWLHASAVAEIMESLMHGFRALGIAADIGENEARADAINIVFMAFFMKESAVPVLPADTVIYNFEQIGGELGFLTPSFRAAISRFRVWDYSLRNIERLAPIMGHSRRQVVPIGYIPALTRIPRVPEQDIDVLFYGSINERRRHVLMQLAAAGLRIHHVFGAYGAERDRLIARAKIVLNIHAHPSKILEVVRISYLLANRKAVVTELDAETEADADFRDAVAGIPYDQITAECQRLVADQGARRDLENHGHEQFRKRDLVSILRRAITEAAQSNQSEAD
jgi:hypothetical protein